MGGIGMKEQKRMIDITAVCLIPIVCIWMKNSYEHYTAKQISIFIGIMFLLINGCLFLKEKRKKDMLMKGTFAVIFLGVAIGYQFDSKMAVIYIADYLCSAFIVFLMKKGWELRKERARAFTKMFLCFGIFCLMYSGSSYYLFEKSIQDYNSMYEMDSMDSPKGTYTAISYMYDMNEKEEYIVFVKIKEKKSEKEKNVYLAAQDNLDVRMKWISEEKMTINGDKLNVTKDVLDKRE